MNSFFLICVSSLWTSLSCCALAFDGFVLLNKNTLFTLSRFSLTAIDSQGTLHLALGLVGMHSAAAFLWMITEYMVLMSLEEYQTCFLQLPYINF